MKADFYFLVIVVPVVIIGLVTWLTAGGYLTGLAEIIAWIVGMLAAILIDTLITTRYTVIILHKQHERERGRHKGDD